MAGQRGAGLPWRPSRARVEVFARGHSVGEREKDTSGSQERRREPDPAGCWVKVAQLIGKLLEALAAGEHQGAGSGHQRYPRACYTWDPIGMISMR